MQTMSLALLCATAVVGTSAHESLQIATLGHSEVMHLLQEWELDGAFGELFDKFRLSGHTLALVDLDTPGKCDAGEWLLTDDVAVNLVGPRPPQIFWNSLCNKLRQNSASSSKKQTTPRRALSESLSDLIASYADAGGMWLNKDEGALKLGVGGDVVVARSDLAELLLIASRAVLAGDLEVNGDAAIIGDLTAQGDLISNGQTLSAVTIASTADTECSFPRILFDPNDSTIHVCNGTAWIRAFPEDASVATVGSCMDVAGSEGLYIIDPTGDADYYTVYCYAEGGMRLTSAFDTYSTYYTTCGGDDDADCLPSGDDGCYLRTGDGTVTTTPCDSSDLVSKKEYQTVELEYIDEMGKAFTEATLAVLSNLYTTSGSAASVWYFDSTDNAGYSLVVDFAGGTASTSHYSEFFTGSNDEEWQVSSLQYPMSNWFGARRIPTSFTAGNLENFGVALILADKSLRLRPISSVRQTCFGAPEGEYLLNPAGIADSFMAYCDGSDAMAIYTMYDSYSAYYSTCGGTDDTDCKPTCGDGCTMENQDGSPIEACCDDASFTSTNELQNVEIAYVDSLGFAIPDDHLDALVDLGVDSTNSNLLIWLFDAADADGYELTVTMHHSAPGAKIITDYNADLNAWDVNNDDFPELTDLFVGVGRIPSGFNVGTKENWGTFVNFAEGQLRLTTQTPKSCSSIEEAGVFDIDPARTGTPFPVYCDGAGTTHLTSAYDGYSTWGPSKCGGTEDDDCYPTCTDGCYATDSQGTALDACCDEVTNKDTEQYSTDFVWIDNDGVEIPEEQLIALATMTDSSLTNFQLFMYDAADSGSYNPSVSFYGGGTNTVTDHDVDSNENGWEVNSDTQYVHGVVGMHRIPKTLIAGTGSGANHGLFFGIGGATLLLTPDSATRRSCLGVLDDGVYLIDPIDNGHAFAAECAIDGTMTIYAETPTFSLEGASKCGGTGLEVCAPTCDNGCLAEGTTTCCADMDTVFTGELTIDLRWKDARGNLINPDQLAWFGDQGFDSSDSDIQIWVFDGSDADGYVFTTEGYGDNSVEITTSWKTDNYIEEEWSETTSTNEDLQILMTAPGIIPESLTITTTSNIGCWVNIPNNGAFQLGPPAVESCDMYLDQRIVEIDPAGLGTTFPIMCDGGRWMLRAQRSSYSTYYSKCGGLDLDSCVPTCEDGCYGETTDGTQTSICCEDWPMKSAQGSQDITYVDEYGSTIDEAQLEALGDSMDSSWTNMQLWMYDSQDGNGYVLGLSYYGANSADFSHTSAYNTGEENAWVINTNDLDIADDMATLMGMHKIPQTLDCGTKENWGVWMGFASSYIVLSAATSTYSTCADVPYTGIFLIDPAATGKAFPTRCGADGSTYLTSKYTGMSVYYSKCGGAEDNDCAPGCQDGCTLTIGGVAGCCDGVASRALSELSELQLLWVDTLDNLITPTQLEALAAMDFDSSVASTDYVWVYDAHDAGSGYEFTVTFYGDEADATATSDSDWNTGDENLWSINSDTYDLSELEGLFFGPNRIPKTAYVGDKTNWGVWWHFHDDTLILTPS